MSDMNNEENKELDSNIHEAEVQSNTAILGLSNANHL